MESFRVIWGIQPFFFFNWSIPGNASQPQKWKPAHWTDASTESRHEMTHQPELYTPRKRTLGPCDEWHTVGRYNFELYTVSLILTGQCWNTETLLLFKKIPVSRSSVNIDNDITVREFHRYLFSSGLFITCRFLVNSAQHNKLFKEGHTWPCSGNSYLSGSWSWKQPV